MTFVSIPISKSTPHTRCCLTAWELTSMTTPAHPFAFISAKRRWSVIGSGRRVRARLEFAPRHRVRWSRRAPTLPHDDASQNRSEKMRRRRLSVGAGDAEEPQVAGRVSVELGGDSRERLRRILDDHARHRGGRPPASPTTTAEAPLSIAASMKSCPSRPRPPGRDEERPLLYRPRIVRNLRDRDIAQVVDIGALESGRQPEQ